MAERKVKNDGDKVWITVSQNVNMGNYQSFSTEVGMSKTYDEKENPEKLIDELSEKLFSVLKKKVKSGKKQMKNVINKK